VNGSSTVSIVIEALMIERRVYSSLYSCGNRVTFSKEYDQCLMDLNYEECDFGKKLPLSVNGRMAVCVLGEPQSLQERASRILFSSSYRVSISKEYFLFLRVFKS
jgi:hypothetical protein